MPCHCLKHLIVPSPCWKLELITLWEWIICLSIWHILIWRRLAQREGAIKILCIHSLLCRYQNWGTLLLFSHVQYIYNLENTDCGGLLITIFFTLLGNCWKQERLLNHAPKITFVRPSSQTEMSNVCIGNKLQDILSFALFGLLLRFYIYWIMMWA